MPQIRWTGWDVNFGHLLTIITVVVGIVVGWTTMQKDVESLRADVLALKARDDAMTTRMAEADREMVRVMTRLETQLLAITATLTRLERRIDRDEDRRSVQ